MAYNCKLIKENKGNGVVCCLKQLFLNCAYKFFFFFFLGGGGGKNTK